MNASLESRNGMAKAGKKLSIIFKNLSVFLNEHITSSITKNEINEFVKQEIEKAQSRALFLGHDAGFGPYPKESVICIDHEIVHGIPNETLVTNDSLLTVDIGIEFEGYCADAARTYTFSDNSQHKTLITATEEAFFESAKIIKAGTDIYDIGKIIFNTAKKYGVLPVLELTGHGIGKEMWEEPHIFQYPAEHYHLKENQTIAIEPIFAFGNAKMKTLSDKWTIVTKDKQLAAQYENTLLVTRNGCEILTL